MNAFASKFERCAGAWVVLICATYCSVAHAQMDPPVPTPTPVPMALIDCRMAAKADCPAPMAVETARGLALGTGMRAAAISTSALAYSPAGLALGNLYHIEANLDYLGGLDTVALGGAVTDSSTSKLTAGISLRGFLAGSDGVDGLDGRLGLALAVTDAISIGLTGRYLDLEQHADPGLSLVQGFTMDASLRVMPTEGLQLDLAVLNFIDRDSPLVPFTIAGGLAFSIGSLATFGADLLADMSTFSNPQVTLGGGLEFVAADVVPLRAGYAVDLARRTHYVTAGVGYSDQRIGLDFGLRQEVHPDSDTRVMGAIRYYVH